MSSDPGREVLCRLGPRLGDAVFALPACRLLHHAGWRVAVEAPNHRALELAEASPYVASVTSGRTSQGKSTPQADLRTFDLAPCDSADSHAFVALAERVAFPLGLDARVCHGGTVVATTKARKSAAQLTGNARRVVVLHPGCAGISKPRWQPWRNPGHPAAWPLEGWVRLADGLRQALGEVVIAVVGTGVEQSLASPLIRQVPESINLVDQTSVQELLALIERSVLFIGNDSGPLHLASTTQTPLVGVFGPSSGPANALPSDSPVQRALRADDMARIGPANVLAAAILAIKAGAEAVSGEPA